jgi:hypothetical protein
VPECPSGDLGGDRPGEAKVGDADYVGVAKAHDGRKEALGKIISRPDGPITGFLQGMGASFIAFGLPLIGSTLVMGLQHHEVLKALQVGGAITAVVCTVAGIGLAIWRLIQAWDYNEIETNR